MKKTLVIGASLKPSRYSNLAIHRLVEKGHAVEGIGLRIGKVAGISIIRLKEYFKDIDTVTLYLNPKRHPEYYEYIVHYIPKESFLTPEQKIPNFTKFFVITI